METLITRFDHQGRGIGYINDKIIFVPFTSIGDVVKVKIVKEKKNYYEGEVIKFIKKSKMHIENLCPYYQVCGGCDLRHISYEDELNYKNDKIKDIVHKYLKENILVNNIIKTDPDNYRNKLTLKVDKKIGLNKKNTNDIVYIDNCLIASKDVNNLLKEINKIDLKNIKSVVIKCSYFTSSRMIVFYTKSGQKFTENIDNLKNKVNTIVVIDDNKQNIIYGKGNIIEKIGQFSYTISPTSFFQVNSVQTNKLYNLILEKCKLSGKEIVYDLYAGSATIGIFISQFCKMVIGIEINKDSKIDALKNIKLNNINNYLFYNEDVSLCINKIKEKPDIIIVDPPRGGLDRNTIDNIIILGPSKIIYVSCDPMTLVRDLNILKENYNICEINPVDMFPRTYHVECVCVLNNYDNNFKKDIDIVIKELNNSKR